MLGLPISFQTWLGWTVSATRWSSSAAGGSSGGPWCGRPATERMFIPTPAVTASGMAAGVVGGGRRRWAPTGSVRRSMTAHQVAAWLAGHGYTPRYHSWILSAGRRRRNTAPNR